MHKLRVMILPNFTGVDTKGDGGIRRIVEAQVRYLPEHGIEVVDNLEDAQVVALHAGDWPRVPVKSGIPIVSHCHGLYWGEYDWAIGAQAVNSRVVHNLLRSDAISVCSEFVARAVRKALWLEPDIIYHGVDQDEWSTPISTPYDGLPYVLWNKARVDAICDPTPVNELAPQLPQVRFMTTYGRATDNVTVVGRVSYVQSKALTKCADVYLGTTRGTFDISVLEAMICSVPVLGWNWGSLSEVVEHKVSGYLAEPQNYDDLIQGYWYIQRHRDSLGRAARERVLSQFLWPKIVAQYAAMYHNVIGMAVPA